MQWVRIVDRTSDFSFVQKFLEGIALLDSNGVLVVDVFETFGRERRHDPRDLREEPVVLRGVRPAGPLSTPNMGQLYPENRAFDFVGAALLPPPRPPEFFPIAPLSDASESTAAVPP